MKNISINPRYINKYPPKLEKDICLFGLLEKFLCFADCFKKDTHKPRWIEMKRHELPSARSIMKTGSKNNELPKAATVSYRQQIMPSGLLVLDANAYIRLSRK